MLSHSWKHWQRSARRGQQSSSFVVLFTLFMHWYFEQSPLKIQPTVDPGYREALKDDKIFVILRYSFFLLNNFYSSLNELYFIVCMRTNRTWQWQSRLKMTSRLKISLWRPNNTHRIRTSLDSFSVNKAGMSNSSENSKTAIEEPLWILSLFTFRQEKYSRKSQKETSW